VVSYHLCSNQLRGSHLARWRGHKATFAGAGSGDAFAKQQGLWVFVNGIRRAPDLAHRTRGIFGRAA
jgi:hypothetical protein